VAAPTDTCTIQALSRSFKITASPARVEHAEAHRGSLFEWARALHSPIQADTIATRMARGWPPLDAITTKPEAQFPRQLALGGETKRLRPGLGIRDVYPMRTRCAAACDWAGHWSRR
jgi:hypothetical protein